MISLKKVWVRDLIFGDIKPKICVPITGTSENQILKDIEDLKSADYDLIELRIDYYEHVENLNMVGKLLEQIRKSCDKAVLFTCRSMEEGGIYKMTEKNYFALNRFAVESGLIDLIDIELFRSEEKIKDITVSAKQHGVKVLMSNHELSKTPSKDEIVDRLIKMQEYGADITKIAVMPNCEEDVLTLMASALKMKKEKADRPFIAISMGSLGAATRLTGELLGSCLTFAALNKPSAPGQINVKYARQLLNLLSL
ncbi:MAG TPA: type I 3-dehydroquinate dehydratase [Clostridiales bacterium]|nr:type I 3-dehydroquinate dehydratase [Clostridiales bacterium]